MGCRCYSGQLAVDCHHDALNGDRSSGGHQGLLLTALTGICIHEDMWVGVGCQVFFVFVSLNVLCKFPVN